MPKSLRAVLLQDIRTNEGLDEDYLKNSRLLIQQLMQLVDKENAEAECDTKTNYLNWPIECLCGYVIYAEIQRVCLLAEAWDDVAIPSLVMAVHLQNCIIAYG